MDNTRVQEKDIIPISAIHVKVERIALQTMSIISSLRTGRNGGWSRDLLGHANYDRRRILAQPQGLGVPIDGPVLIATG